MLINTETKISALLKENPEALEAIIEISSRFSMLRNPVIRKIMAAKTSIGTASKIGGCDTVDFFKKLQPLGFIVDNSETGVSAEEELMPVPAFMKNENRSDVQELDVRPVLDSGNDPYAIIMGRMKQLPDGSILKLVNSFEPSPLIKILSKKGFEYYVEHVNADVVNTYFHKVGDFTPVKQTRPEIKQAVDWDTVLKRYEGKIVTVDVRNLEMPLPMLTILEKSDKLPDDKALFVYHKRIPVFLLPELKEKGFEYRINEISQDEVHLLIYRIH